MTTPSEPNGPLVLIERAASVAAERVVKGQQRRMIIVAALAALVAATTIALPVTFVLDKNNADAGAERARFNCSQWNEGATVLQLFVESLATLREDQRKALNEADRGRAEKVVRDFREEDARTQKYWRSELVPRLRTLARVNCQFTFTSGGVKAGGG